MNARNPAILARNMAVSMGITEADAYYVTGRDFSVEVYEGKVEAFNYADVVGLGVRVLDDGRAGYAYTEQMDESSIRRAVERASASAPFAGREADGDEVYARVRVFPEPAEVEGIYEGELQGVAAARKVEMALEIERAARGADARIVNVPHSGYIETIHEVSLANTRGVERSFKSDAAYAYCVPLAEEAGDRKTGYDVKSSRRFSEFDADGIGRRAAERALELLGAEQVSSGRYNVMFDRLVAADFLQTFAPAFSGKLAQEGRSVLAGRVGKKIGSAEVTIVDDATVPAGPGSRPFDDEGHPSRRNVLVERGRFLGFLHNTESAAKDGVESTGNASRSYKGPLGVSRTNFILSAGRRSRDDLLVSSTPCILVTSMEGFHSGCSVVSGEFSLSCRGFIYDGNGRKPVHEFTVSGDFAEMLGAVEAVADDFEMQPSGVGCGSILVRDLSVAGK